MAITVTAPRTFFRTFAVMAQLWFAVPSGYVTVAFMFVLITFSFHNPAPLWLAASCGLGWVVAMFPFLLALQAWRVLRATKESGVPVFTFDEEGAACATGAVVTRLPWSGIHRIRFDARTCFVYVTPRAAWFFGRALLTKGQEAALSDFARRSNVKLEGRAPSESTSSEAL
ncbi:YcxB family protein [Luteibacter sp. OK325]|uniref:YcxB family protein n=1 Tax=Luteibacter sp. OK325 TaxID=2135670 RepID=UPI0011B218CB|nr:YcxB family protein [Luteibacter sp. OK325]